MVRPRKALCRCTGYRKTALNLVSYRLDKSSQNGESNPIYTVRTCSIKAINSNTLTRNPPIYNTTRTVPYDTSLRPMYVTKKLLYFSVHTQNLVHKLTPDSEIKRKYRPHVKNGMCYTVMYWIWCTPHIRVTSNRTGRPWRAPPLSGRPRPPSSSAAGPTQCTAC